MHQSTYDVAIGALLVATLACIGFAIRTVFSARDANRDALAKLAGDFTRELSKVSISLAELNTGASAGARAAILDVREEMRNGFRDVTRDVQQLRSEHDNLAERHASANGSIVQLAERVDGTREQLREVRRDLYEVRPRSTPSDETEGH